MRSQRAKRINYKELHQGKKQPLSEGNTAVSKHLIGTPYQTDNITYQILGYDTDKDKRLYKEAIHIRCNNPTLNEDPGKKFIPHIYDNLFKTNNYKKAKICNNTKYKINT